MQIAVFILVLLFYVLACVLPAASGPGSAQSGPHLDKHTRGILLLLYGWLTFAWWANVALAIGLLFLLLKKWALASVLGALAFALGLTTWTMVKPQGEILEVHVGYYLWQSSMIVLTGGALIICVNKPKHQ